MGHLCQGIWQGEAGDMQQQITGTDTIRLIDYDKIPRDQCKKIAHVRVVCEVRSTKADPDRTHITVTGGNIKFPCNLGTPTTSLDLVKLIVNSVLSHYIAKFAC